MKNWKPRQLLLIEILGRGQRDEDGTPLSLREVAKKIGISRKTLREWRNLEGFTEAVYQRSSELIGRRLPNVLGAMADGAIEDRDVAAARLCLEVTGKLNKDHGALEAFEALYIRLGAGPMKEPTRGADD